MGWKAVGREDAGYKGRGQLASEGRRTDEHVK